MKKILFVDDESHVLQGLQRMLHHLRQQWDMRFAGSGDAALQMLESEPFDIIVTDLRMPVMDGAELLEEVMRRWPRMIRIVLSGQVEIQTAYRSVQLAHQFIAKPCDAETLTAIVARSIALHNILEDETIKQAVAGMGSLPTLPSLYFDIMREIQSETGSLAKVGRIVATDIGMSAKILQLVNSAFFGLAKQMANPAQAAVYLGMDTIRALVLSVQVFSRYSDGKAPSLNMDALWRHSMNVALGAKRIIGLEGGNQAQTDFAFIGGLLHDVGKIVLAVSLPEKYAQASSAAAPGDVELIEAERAIFYVSHAEVGAYLLGIWGLQDPLVEAVCFHHNPSAAADLTFGPLTAVHFANACSEAGPSAENIKGVAKLDHNYLTQTKKADRVAAWFEACKSIAQRGETDG